MLPSGSLNEVNDPQASVSTSLASTPRPRSSWRAASASGTTTWMLFCVPGVMSVMPSPNAIELADLGGVTCTNLTLSSTRACMSSVNPTYST